PGDHAWQRRLAHQENLGREDADDRGRGQASELDRLADRVPADAPADGDHPSGEAGPQLRDRVRQGTAASSRLRDAVEAAAAAATGVLGRAGHATSEETGRRIRATLQAAATAGAAERRALWTGTVDRDLDAAGFGAMGQPEDDVPDLAAILKPLRRRSPSAHREPSSQRTSAAVEVLSRREAEREAAHLESAAQRARTAADSKRHQAERMAEEARVVAEEASAAEDAANAAEAAARAARAARSG
ncbi:MAG: hypothetical protein WB808_10480, partial [Candidatus Dormiibacterota bacterium]